MKAKQKDPVRALLLKIEAKKAKLKKLRDDLRDDVDELEGIIDSMGEAVELLEEGMRNFSDATDEMSKYV